MLLILFHYKPLHDMPVVIKPFSCSTELSMKFILLINVKMPTVVGILTIISMTIEHLSDLKQAPCLQELWPLLTEVYRLIL